LMTDDCSIRSDNGFAKPAKAFVADLMQRMRRKYPSLILVDPQAVQCRAGSCQTVSDATPMYVDTHHLSAFGSTALARLYRMRIGNPLIAGSTPSTR
jgi:SGNH domain (fused to AT3 domains)